jgi:hypothetical protein
MKKLLFGLVVGLVLILIVIQLIPVEQTNPPVTSDIPTSPEMKAILKRACYDCHSNETVWTWYSRIAPVSWLVAWDVAKGREEVNYSTWDQYSAEDQAEKIHESWETVAEGEMPPWYYTVIHPEARLSYEDRQMLRTWARESPQVKEENDEDENHEKLKNKD